MITIKISLGEALDRLSILRIKRDMLGEALGTDSPEYRQLKDQVNELKLATLTGHIAQFADQFVDLLETNKRLWELEDLVRLDLKTQEPTGSKRLEWYKKITQLNDKRAQIKREINDSVGHTGEIKHYA